jgi:uncharacterized ion transporter superfamily protein YfcC
LMAPVNSSTGMLLRICVMVVMLLFLVGYTCFVSHQKKHTGRAFLKTKKLCR